MAAAAHDRNGEFPVRAEGAAGLALAFVMACGDAAPRGFASPWAAGSCSPALEAPGGGLPTRAERVTLRRAGSKDRFSILASRLEDGLDRWLWRRPALPFPSWAIKNTLHGPAVHHGGSPRGGRPARAGGTPAGPVFSPYDGLIRTSAARHGMDWLLVAALISHESGFNPCLASSAGAVGLMQVMPSTAAQLGFLEPWEPRQNIEAGVQYLRLMYDAFRWLDEIDRTACAVAAYCAGLGHVRDACSLSVVDGRDPSRWAGNVEETLAQLSNPEFARRATYGGAQGHQAVAFANLVVNRWQGYAAMRPAASGTVRGPSGPPRAEP